MKSTFFEVKNDAVHSIEDGTVATSPERSPQNWSGSTFTKLLVNVVEVIDGAEDQGGL